MTYDMQVWFIIIFDMINELYVQVLFWFLARGSWDVQAELGQMQDDFCKGVRYPKQGIDVKDVDYFYTRGGYDELEIVWVYPQEYLLRDLVAIPDKPAID